jgi:hypothetical protein
LAGVVVEQENLVYFSIFVVDGFDDAAAVDAGAATADADADDDDDDDDDDEEEVVGAFVPPDVAATAATAANRGSAAIAARVIAVTCASASGDGLAPVFGFVSRISMFLTICCSSCCGI